MIDFANVVAKVRNGLQLTGAFLIPLAIYIKTLAPTYVAIDSAELALCMNFWGICHPPGYPLYIAIGKIFVSILPFGEIVWRANLLSAIFGAATILLVYLLLLKLSVERVIAFLLAILLAFSPVFWELAISADVFTFGAFLLSLSFYFLLSGRRNLTFFALGLSASHSYLTGFLLPLFIWYWKRLDSRINPASQSRSFRNVKAQEAVLVLFVFCIGFLPQLLMYWRMAQAPEINWGHVSNFWQFIDFVRRREFGGFFLLANEGIKFSPVNFYKHLVQFFANTLSNLGLILPVVTPFIILWGRLWRQKRVSLLLAAFWVLVVLQLLSISTIDPGGEYNPLTATKFYLMPFVVLVLLIGMSLDYSMRKFFGGGSPYIVGFLVLAVFFNLASNFKNARLNQNYFSQNFVEDSLGQLPAGSVAITVDHAFYFAGVLEQKVNGKFGDVDLLYFANENNRDGEFYQPDLFGGDADGDFAREISRGKTLGRSEGYILDTISRNLDKPLYIRQGGFEETFFDYLAPYIKPYGLWWKVERDENAPWDGERGLELLGSFANGQVNPRDLHLRQQKIEALAYYVAYNSTARELVRVGRYNEAKELLLRVLLVTDRPEVIKQRIREIEGLKNL